MVTNAGVWIDYKQAIVVLVSEASEEIKKIAFAVEEPIRSTGNSLKKNKFTPNDFIAEDRQERKVENDRKAYYDDVVASLREAQTILILGPGEAKGEFNKRIKSKKLRGVTIELETADKMTDRQLAAKVRKHFAAAPISKSVAPQGTAKKKAAKPASGKSTKKTKK